MSGLVAKISSMGKDTLEGVKEREGFLGRGASKAEGGFLRFLDSGVGKVVVSVKDRLVELADWAVDTAQNSVVVKAGGTIYNDGVLPVYQGGMKVTRRSASCVLSAPGLALSVPGRIYGLLFIGADKVVDFLLPEEDEIVATGPLSLVKKASTRLYTRSIRLVDAAVQSVKNALSIFKKAAKFVYTFVRRRVVKIYDLVVTMRRKVHPQTLTVFLLSCVGSNVVEIWRSTQGGSAMKWWERARASGMGGFADFDRDRARNEGSTGDDVPLQGYLAPKKPPYPSILQ